MDTEKYLAQEGVTISSYGDIQSKLKQEVAGGNKVWMELRSTNYAIYRSVKVL
jgi:hypothetical protein